MRIMRLLVMFDLPTKTKSDRDRYTRFKRFLEDDGYTEHVLMVVLRERQALP